MGPSLRGVARRLVGTALLLFPPAFRRRFGPEMRDAFDDQVRDAESQGVGSVLRVTLAALANVAGSASREWMQPTHPGPAGTTTGRGSMMDALWQDLRFAVRSLARRPGFALVAVTTVALGIGANTAIFSVVNGVLLRPLPYPEPHGLAMVWAHGSDAPEGRGVVSLPDIRDMDSLPSIRAVEGYSASSVTLTGGERPEVVPSARVTGGLLDLMGVAPHLGRDLRRDETGPAAPRRAVISWDLWQERFQADPAVVGRTFELAEEPYEIVGVAPRDFGFPDGARVWYGERNAGSEGCQRGCNTLRAVARLTEPDGLSRAERELQALAAGLAEAYPDSNFDKRFRPEGLTDFVVGDVRSGLWMILGAVGLVLLIACANVANLLLVRASSRRTEVSVRSALGAGRRRLVAQVLTESAVLSAAGAALGVGLAVLGLGALRSMADGAIPRMAEVAVDGTVLAFTAAVTVAVALLFGLVPALDLARSPSSLGGGAGRGGSSRRDARSRGVLLAAEVGLSLVLLVGAGLLLRSFERFYAVELGYDARQVLRFTTSLPDRRYPELSDVSSFYRTLEERLVALPGVEGVGFGFGSPLGFGNATGEVLVEGREAAEPGRETYGSIKPVSPGYFDVLRTPVLRGRGIEAGDVSSTRPVAVVNETFVRENFPGADPLGQGVEVTVDFGYTKDRPVWEIVGVVADVRSRGPREEVRAEIFVPHAQFGPGYVDVLVRTAEGVTGILPAVRQEVSRLDGNVALRNVGTLEDAVHREGASARLYMTLVMLFAGLAVFLAAVGLYGVVAFLVIRRTREIGVRMALGARSPSVTRLVVFQGLRPAAWGIVLGLATVWAGGRVLESILFQVEPRDPWVLGSVTVLLLVVVLVASLIPAARAARIDPSRALRSE